MMVLQCIYLKSFNMYKQLSVLVLYGLIATTAMANSPPGHGSGDSHHSGSSGDSSAAVSIGSDSQSIDLADSSSQEAVSSNQTIINYKREIEVAAQAVSIALPYCSSGGSAGTVRLTISTGEVDYSCQVVNSINTMLSLVKPKLEQAHREPDPVKKQALIEESRQLLDNIYSLSNDLYTHLNWEYYADKVWDSVKIIGFIVLIGVAL